MIFLDSLREIARMRPIVCSLDLKGAPKDREEDNRLYRRGITQLGNHLVSVAFRLPEAKLAAAKAARLARILKNADYPSRLPAFDPTQTTALVEKNVPMPFSCLNRLKNFAPEVFFHWV